MAPSTADITRLEGKIDTLSVVVTELSTGLATHAAAQTEVCASERKLVHDLHRVVLGDGNGMTGVVRRQDALVAWRQRVTWWQAAITLTVMGMIARVLAPVVARIFGS